MAVTWTKSKKKSSTIYPPDQTFKKKKIKGTLNQNTNKPIVLEEGEVLCSVCHGEGVEWRVNIKTITNKTSLECTKCDGNGKLNWLDNMMGGKKEDNIR